MIFDVAARFDSSMPRIRRSIYDADWPLLNSSPSYLKPGNKTHEVALASRFSSRKACQQRISFLMLPPDIEAHSAAWSPAINAAKMPPNRSFRTYLSVLPVFLQSPPKDACESKVSSIAGRKLPSRRPMPDVRRRHCRQISIAASGTCTGLKRSALRDGKNGSAFS